MQCKDIKRAMNAIILLKDLIISGAYGKDDIIPQVSIISRRKILIIARAMVLELCDIVELEAKFCFVNRLK